MEKTGKSNPQTNNLPLRFGSFAEEFVANEYTKATGHGLEHQLEPVIHPEHAFLQGHIDRLVFSKNASTEGGPTHLLECKTANPFSRSDWGDEGSDEVPMTYLAQCHWYLALTQLPRCDLAVLFGNSEFRIYHIESDQALQATLIERAIAFWQKHVLVDIAPDPQCIEDYQHLFSTEVVGKTVLANTEIAQLITQFHTLHHEIDEKEASMNQIKQAIMAHMGDAEKLLYQDQVLATWKRPKASMRFDSKRFELEHPQLFPLYQTPIANSRRLVIKELPKNPLN